MDPLSINGKFDNFTRINTQNKSIWEGQLISFDTLETRWDRLKLNLKQVYQQN